MNLGTRLGAGWLLVFLLAAAIGRNLQDADTLTREYRLRFYNTQAPRHRVSPRQRLSAGGSRFATPGNRVYSAFLQELSGSNRVGSAAALPPAGSISFSKTVPLWFTMNVWIPLTPYSAGHATRPKPPINLPPTM